MHLNRHHGVRVQTGGSDQWGNIVAGARLKGPVPSSNATPVACTEASLQCSGYDACLEGSFQCTPPGMRLSNRTYTEHVTPQQAALANLAASCCTRMFRLDEE